MGRDRNESFSVAKDDILKISKNPYPKPDIVTRHKDLYSSFTKASHALGLMLISHIGAGLHLPKNTLESHFQISSQSTSQVRLVHVNPQPADDRRTSFNGHLDKGAITILFHVLGGLEVSYKEGYKASEEKDYKPVKPVPGCALVLIGKWLEIFTREGVDATMHRVTFPPGKQAELSRISLGYLMRAEKDDPLQKRNDQR